MVLRRVPTRGSGAGVPQRHSATRGVARARDAVQSHRVDVRRCEARDRNPTSTSVGSRACA